MGRHRGAPRLFLDAWQASRAGFRPGEAFEVVVDGQSVRVERCADGSRLVSRRVRNGEDLPVIDINSRELLKAFEGMELVRVIVRAGCVVLLPLASEIKAKKRLERAMAKLQLGQPLAVGSVAHGGGILSAALRDGLEAAGVRSTPALVSELRADLVEHVLARETGTPGGEPPTNVLAGPMQEMVQDEWLMQRLPQLDCLDVALPCSAASRAGIAKRHLAKMEDHPEVGHLVVAALAIIERTQPVAVAIENVELYSTSGSASILRNCLRDMGFRCHEAVVRGRDYGALEDRVRWVMVAVTRGVEFDFADIRPGLQVLRRLGDVLDPDIGPEHGAWRRFDGLVAKAERDRLAGKGFKMQVMSPEDMQVPTLRKGYSKAGTTDPLLQHPSDPERFRLLTPEEHARVKGVPEHMVDGLPQSVAHQVLGQGIVYAPFVAIGQAIGAALARHAFGQASEVDGERGPEDQADGMSARLLRHTG